MTNCTYLSHTEFRDFLQKSKEAGFSMRYAGMPMGMWIVFGKNFRKNLTEVLNYDESEGRKITVSAKKSTRSL